MADKLFIVDASVVSKWFNRGEVYEKESLLLRDSWIRGRVSLYAPDQIKFEVANSVWKNPNIETSNACALVRLLIRVCPYGMMLDQDNSEQAMILARKTKLTFYDTIYLSMSHKSQYPLITADSEQLLAARGYTKAVHLSAVEKILSEV